MTTNIVPELSVLIVTYNSASVITDCLNSLQLSSLATEIIVVDNGSSDATVRIIQADFSWVHLIRSKSNLGFAKANNLAFQISQGRYLMMLNPDTEVSPAALGKLVQFADLHPEAGIIGPKIVNPEGQLQHSTVRLPDYHQALYGFIERLNPGYDTKRNGRYELADYERVREVEVVLGAAALVRREAWEQSHGLDEKFEFYYEDTDLSYRVRKAGWKLLYTPDATIMHIGEHSTRQNRVRSEMIKAHSQVYFFKKNYGYRGFLQLKATVAFGLAYWLLRSIFRCFRRKASWPELPAQFKYCADILLA